MTASRTELFEELMGVPAFDIHTHMDASHLGARGLHDILLYHMVGSELYSAGCPHGERMPDEPTQDAAERRMLAALPYVKNIRNTSCYYGVRLILKDLYGFDEDVTPENWRAVDEAVREKNRDGAWARSVMKKAGIRRACTELWRGRDGLADDVFRYSLEWAFFTRSQWGQFDTALLELEHAWNQEVPGPPLPVTLDREQLRFKKTIRTLDDVHAAVAHYCDRIPYNRILSIASHFSTDITYRPVTGEEMARALAARANAGPWERDVYANYVTELFFTEIEKRNLDLALQFSMGAEPLPYETGSKLRPETLFELAGLFARHPKLKFSFFVSSAHQNQAFCTLLRELPNLSASGYWWHNFFPGFIRQVMDERLDMLPLNRQIGLFTDAYCMDWAYAKSVLIRQQMAVVLGERIARGQYTRASALDIAREILYETPKTLLGMKEAE